VAARSTFCLPSTVSKKGAGGDVEKKLQCQHRLELSERVENEEEGEGCVLLKKLLQPKLFANYKPLAIFVLNIKLMAVSSSSLSNVTPSGRYIENNVCVEAEQADHATPSPGGHVENNESGDIE